MEIIKELMGGKEEIYSTELAGIMNTEHERVLSLIEELELPCFLLDRKELVFGNRSRQQNGNIVVYKLNARDAIVLACVLDKFFAADFINDLYGGDAQNKIYSSEGEPSLNHELEL